jgi:rubredoxin
VITGDSISQENACITSCGHVFTKSGLTRWLSVSSNQSCPVCRQKCSLA